MSMVDLNALNAKAVYRNLSVSRLVEAALLNREGILMEGGALAVETGKYTGRAAKDKYIVDSDVTHDRINWGSINHPMTRDTFDKILEKALKHLGGKEVYVFDGLAGADRSVGMKMRIINEYASQNLFIHQLLIRLDEEELKNFGEPDFTIIAVPDLKLNGAEDGVRDDAVVALDLDRGIVVIAGTRYAGEIKKSVFTIMNYFMPMRNVLPMHASANMDPVTGKTAVFFGLSGTGKTTLSADSSRDLIGDDEHGWTDNGIFNFEGGCYAKCIGLSEEKEPDIYHAVRFGALAENVVVDPITRKPDYNDASLTENTRVGYPVDYIPTAANPSIGGIPEVVIFLTADAFGVLPPISRLSKEAAKYQFISGFTSKVAGTEDGITEPQPAFSTLFGEPFMPWNAEVYADMLGKKLDQFGTRVYLVNTGWTGGSYGTGERMSLKYTRAMVRSALNGTIEEAKFEHDERFNLDRPLSCPMVPDEILNPRNTWADKDAYDATADKLAGMFEENFATKYPNISKEIAEAGPKPLK